MGLDSRESYRRLGKDKKDTGTVGLSFVETFPIAPVVHLIYVLLKSADEITRDLNNENIICHAQTWECEIAYSTRDIVSQ